MMSTIGQSVRFYRQRKGISQLDLELAIKCAEGLVSKIELSKVNPTKETLNKIISELQITPIEAAHLFEIDHDYFANLISVSRKLQSYKDRNELINNAVDDIINAMNLGGSSIYLIENNRLYLKSLSTIRYTQLARQTLPFSPFIMSFNLDKDKQNALVRCVVEQEKVITYELYDLMVPFAPKFLCEKIQQISRIKSMIIFPLINNSGCIGAMVFGKSLKDNFEPELSFLQEFTKIVAQLILV
jgi:transcriptional regulator with XRE-family HTH domain